MVFYGFSAVSEAKREAVPKRRARLLRRGESSHYFETALDLRSVSEAMTRSNLASI